jgi:predicted Rossmann-fold nucleotide-binding protein
LFCPGGLGTLHQLFEVLTLVQTHKVDKTPLILFDTEFWGPLVEYIDKVFAHEYGTIKLEDEKLFTLTSNKEEVLATILQNKQGV